MKSFRSAFGAMASALLVVACGGTNSETPAPNPSGTHGTLVENPPLRIASVDAAAFQAQLASTASGQQLLQITGNPACGVDFYYLKFYTLGGANEATESTGADGAHGRRGGVLRAATDRALRTRYANRSKRRTSPTSPTPRTPKAR